MSKNIYEAPVMEIVLFDAEDVIDTSGLTDGGTFPGSGDDDFTIIK